MGKKSDKVDVSFIEEIEEAYGRNIIYREDKEIEVISTGSLALDISLGRGGIPKGRITEIFGPDGSAKTTLCLSIAKHCEEKILYVDMEQGLDFNYIRAVVGEIDFDRFVLVQPETAEQGMLICEKAIRTGEFSLIVLDSLGAMSPEKERNEELGDKNVALIASLLTQFLRRNAFAIREFNTAFIFVNQVRANISASSFFKTYETPGGYALRHYESIKIKLGKFQNIERGKGNVVGIYSRFTITKNKIAPPFKTFTFPVIFGTGIDYERDVIDFAEMLGIVTKNGSHYTFGGETFGHGAAKAGERLKEDKLLLDKIVELCYNSTIGRNEVKEQEELDE